MKSYILLLSLVVGCAHGVGDPIVGDPPPPPAKETQATVQEPALECTVYSTEIVHRCTLYKAHCDDGTEAGALVCSDIPYDPTPEEVPEPYRTVPTYPTL